MTRIDDRLIAIFGLWGMVNVSSVVADEPFPPHPAQPKLVQPVQQRLPLLNSRLMQFQEEVETLEAQSAIKKAQVRLAEVNLMAQERRLELMNKAATSVMETEAAKFDVLRAKAELDIRKAEMREVEVRLKQVKRRLDEAKPAVPAKPKAEEPRPGHQGEEPGAAQRRERAEADLQRLREQMETVDLRHMFIGRADQL